MEQYGGGCQVLQLCRSQGRLLWRGLRLPAWAMWVVHDSAVLLPQLVNLTHLQSHESIVKMHGACVSEHVRYTWSVVTIVLCVRITVTDQLSFLLQPFIVLEFAPLSLEKGMNGSSDDCLFPCAHINTFLAWGFHCISPLLYLILAVLFGQWFTSARRSTITSPIMWSAGLTSHPWGWTTSTRRTSYTGTSSLQSQSWWSHSREISPEGPDLEGC